MSRILASSQGAGGVRVGLQVPETLFDKSLFRIGASPVIQPLVRGQLDAAARIHTSPEPLASAAFCHEIERISLAARHLYHYEQQSSTDSTGLETAAVFYFLLSRFSLVALTIGLRHPTDSPSIDRRGWDRQRWCR